MFSRSRPWIGVASADQAAGLKQRHGFRDDFDLQDKLSEAVWCYRRRTHGQDPVAAMRNAIREHDKSLKKIHFDGTLEHATTLEILTLRFQGLDTSMPASLGQIRKAARQALNRDRGLPANRRGRPRKRAVMSDLANKSAAQAETAVPDGWSRNPFLRTFYRTLAAIYEDGTGKLPAAAHRGNKYRGRCYHFVSHCCKLLDIPAHPRAIQSEVLFMRYERPRRKMQVLTS